MCPPRPPAEGTVSKGLQVGRGRAALHAGGPGGKVWLEGTFRGQAHLLPSAALLCPVPPVPVQRPYSCPLELRLRGGPRAAAQQSEGRERRRQDSHTDLPSPRRARGRPSPGLSLQPESATRTPRGDAAAPEGPQAAGPRANPLPPLRELERRAPRGCFPVAPLAPARARAAAAGAARRGGGRGEPEDRADPGARGAARGRGGPRGARAGGLAGTAPTFPEGHRGGGRPVGPARDSEAGRRPSGSPAARGRPGRARAGGNGTYLGKAGRVTAGGRNRGAAGGAASGAGPAEAA